MALWCVCNVFIYYLFSPALSSNIVRCIICRYYSYIIWRFTAYVGIFVNSLAALEKHHYIMAL